MAAVVRGWRVGASSEGGFVVFRDASERHVHRVEGEKCFPALKSFVIKHNLY